MSPPFAFATSSPRSRRSYLSPPSSPSAQVLFRPLILFLLQFFRRRLLSFASSPSRRRLRLSADFLFALFRLLRVLRRHPSAASSPPCSSLHAFSVSRLLFPIAPPFRPPIHGPSLAPRPRNSDPAHEADPHLRFPLFAPAPFSPSRGLALCRGKGKGATRSSSRPSARFLFPRARALRGCGPKKIGKASSASPSVKFHFVMIAFSLPYLPIITGKLRLLNLRRLFSNLAVFPSFHQLTKFSHPASRRQNRPIACLLPLSLGARSLAPSLPCSLARLLPRSLSLPRSLAPSLPRSLAPSLPRSLPLGLSPIRLRHS